MQEEKELKAVLKVAETLLEVGDKVTIDRVIARALSLIRDDKYSDTNANLEVT